jgi:translin
MTIESLVTACTQEIDAHHTAREEALVISRTLIRQCARTIRATHRSEFEEAARLLKEASSVAAELVAAVDSFPSLKSAGYTQDALKEYAEAALVYAFLTDTPTPAHTTLQIEPAAYLNGLAEAASELRRAILDRIRRGEIQPIEGLLAIMDDVYSLLITVDYPEVVTGGLRRSTDALRSVLERTRGDVTAALRQEQLTAALHVLETRLSQE